MTYINKERLYTINTLYSTISIRNHTWLGMQSILSFCPWLLWKIFCFWILCWLPCFLFFTTFQSLFLKFLPFLLYFILVLLFACRHIIICISNSVVFLNLCSFLQRVVGSLVSLLKSGADREPEIIEQVQIMVSMNFFAIPFFCFLSG